MAEKTLRSFEYLEGLSGTELGRLYQQPSTALAVFRRMLPHMAKSLVLAMLYNPAPLARADLEAWVKAENEKDLQKSISLLMRLHILEQVHDRSGRIGAYRVRRGFAASLQQALTGGGAHNSFGVPCEETRSSEGQPQRRVSVDQLDDYARSKWEGMLGYMVANTSGSSSVLGHQFGDVEPTVKVLLKMGGYVEERSRTRVSITEKGFALLMQKTNAQVWAVLVVYLSSTTEETHINPTDALSFFFMLGSLELGQDYSTANLTDSQKIILEDLAHLGLVYQSSSRSSRFYPTRLATTLTSDAPALREVAISSVGGSGSTAGNGGVSSSGDAGSSGEDGFIVIETNYRVYAYTTSALHIAIMQLFTRIYVRFPNMVAGKITRNSVRKAVAMGVTADQIIDFLSAHAHPQMRKASAIATSSGASANAAGTSPNQVLPPTVVDQIRLWQLENERMATTPGYLFKEFNSEEDYRQLARYADEIGVLKWKSDRERKFFVTRHEQLAAYYKSNMLRRTGDGSGGGGAAGRG